MKNKKIRIIIASVLIVVGISSLVLWEVWGRELIAYKTLIVAEREIKPGEIIVEDMLEKKSIMKDSLIVDYINEKKPIIGKVAKQFIAKGSQLHSKYFEKKENYIRKGESIYKIPATWIDMRSSSIRKDDVIEIYAEGVSFGKFKVAFVKDNQEREITSIKNQLENALERTESTGVIDNIEIVTTLEKYNMLKTQAADALANASEKFVIVQVIEGER